MENPERLAGHRRKYKRTHTAQSREQQRAGRERCRRLVIARYSGGKNICACCGEWRYDFLSIDHIAGDGSQHKIKGRRASGSRLYRWLIANAYPDGYRVLCFNCNCANGFRRACPHVAERAADAVIAEVSNSDPERNAVNKFTY